MYSFLLSLAVLILGYVIYGAYIERILKPDASVKTVAFTKQDGVDYIPFPKWKLFMIQYLNIAGLGPIFGAIMGAKFGVASYLWIVLGSIFAGAVHDFVAGMISLRNEGESLPESVGRYLGMTTGQVMRVFTVFLMVLVAAVFVSGPAGLLAKMTQGINPFFNVNFWIVVIFVYYIFATLMPIDKIVGRIYPLFSVALLFMALGIFVTLLFSKGWSLPEFTSAPIVNPDAGSPLFPMMFISIACGAISGFHASQSPLMARCMTSEKLARPIFYGGMIVEGIEALIWAAAATWFFHHNGFGETNAAIIVDQITKSWLGPVGSVLALLGVVFAPISSGDTALRSARLIVADILKYEQKSVSRRMMITIPLVIVTFGILLYSLINAEGFNTIWRYFAGANQALSVFTLWMVAVYLAKRGVNYFVGLIPALFMTCVVLSYVVTAPEALGLSMNVAYVASAVAVVFSVVMFARWKRKCC